MCCACLAKRIAPSRRSNKAVVAEWRIWIWTSYLGQSIILNVSMRRSAIDRMSNGGSFFVQTVMRICNNNKMTSIPKVVLNLIYFFNARTLQPIWVSFRSSPFHTFVYCWRIVCRNFHLCTGDVMVACAKKWFNLGWLLREVVGFYPEECGHKNAAAFETLHIKNPTEFVTFVKNWRIYFHLLFLISTQHLTNSSAEAAFLSYFTHNFDAIRRDFHL